MAKHKKELALYNGDFTSLATELGNLRYDALAEFLHLLSEKLHQDGIADANRGRVKLATQLQHASKSLESTANAIEEAWRICKPYMDAYEK
ncbi:MAG: hypothetical protein ACK4TA_23275 [Saprospiraceae bacterium]